MSGGAARPRRELGEAERLVHEGLPVLEGVARRLARRLGGRIDRDELFGLGQPVLLEIARTFDPSKGKFTTYAALKIKWAILDGLRRDTNGRSLSARGLALAASERVAEAYAAEPEPGADATEEDDRLRLRGMLAAHAVALATGLTAGHGAPGQAPGTPEDDALRAELARALRLAVGGLPERQRVLVERHYFGGEPFDEIARDLGVSKSWASRLHGQAMAALARALEHPDD